MNWVKQNYDRFLLAVFAVILLACAGVLLTNARGYNDVFNSLKDVVPKKPGLGVTVHEDDIANAEKALATPDQWNARMLKKGRLPLFVSVPYIAKTEGGSSILVDPLGDESRALHDPVPNAWLIDNKQDLLAPNVLDQDTDGDGFTTLEEYLGKTDPNNKDSHPPYSTKLVLKRLVRIPFRLRFDARNGIVFQVNTIDVEDAPTLFLKMNDMVKGTKFKITKFEEKFDTKQGFKKDVSELTLTNVETGQTVVLPKQQEVDSPTTYAVLTYLWMGNRDFGVQKGAEFTLKPDENVKYRVTDLSDAEVLVVKEDDNKQLHIRPLAAPR